VGDTKDEAAKTLHELRIPYEQNRINDTTSRFSWIIPNEYQMIIVFNNSGIATRQTLIPEKENGVNEFVSNFNKDYVKISDIEWRNYENGRIYKITLEYILTEPFFSITLSENSRKYRETTHARPQILCGYF
jgi:hypothetical protein